MIQLLGWQMPLKATAGLPGPGCSHWRRMAALLRETMPRFDWRSNRLIPLDYVLLLNPDTIVRPGAISALIKFMDAHPTVGIAGSRLEHPDGSPQPSAFRFPSVASEFEEGSRLGWISRLLASQCVAPPPPEEQSPAEWVAGASMIIRKAVFEAIGLLDERYFMYYEEVDFCRRAKDAGWPCWYVPQSRGRAPGGTKLGRDGREKIAEATTRLLVRVPSAVFSTHHGRMATVLADLLWAAGFAQWRVRRALLGKPDPDPQRLLSDFIRHNFFATS